jgi:hypothetical protein
MPPAQAAPKTDTATDMSFSTNQSVAVLDGGQRMPNDNFRPDDHAASTISSIADSMKKGKPSKEAGSLKPVKPPTDQRLLIIAVIIIALAGVVLGLVTHQYMMLVAANAPLIAAIQIFQNPRRRL